ncbi:piRNA biogenesis protein EXD1 [Cyclopterus lumpus]|uniref:piRNA biogenesis protein EXD1 n=1 Tax=Cyclopterus lumpus TaxID=8103 RepID=UPI0014872960|nr:piRNA biogenesis protein EXD1 [Cyclopterus lumpus]
MAVDEVQFLNILKGKRVKLTLKTSSYFGVIQRINLNKTLILTDVVCGHNGFKCPGSKMFFGHEVIHVEFANEADTGSGNIHDHGLEEHLDVEKFQAYRKTIALDEDAQEQEYFNYVVIDEFHEKFVSAVMHIKKQSVISVGADGVEVFKYGRLCWLQIATKHKVYLFDILLLGARAFKNGLSMILENKRILKVIHDCRAIAGCLIAQFGVKLTNVFDTQIADVMCFYSKTGGLLPDRVSTLQEVVSFHLKVPSSQLLSLQMKSQLTKEEREMWFKRPCPIPLLKLMALSAIHLQPLRLVLLDTLMMDYMALVDSYLNSGFYEPDELQHVNMESVLELPRELRQLEVMRRERQEWAADHYHVTEQGLLDRYNLRAPSPMQTLPAAEVNGQQHATVELPSQVDPLLFKSPTSPRRANNMLSVDVCASPDSADQPPVPGNLSDLGEQMSVNSSLSLVGGRGCTEVLMNTAGRGSPFGKEQSSIPALRAFGRGFLLQTSQDQVPRESIGDVMAPDRMGTAPSGHSHAPAQEGIPQPGPSANDLPKNGTAGDYFTSTAESISSSLAQSFRSFRY